VRPDPEIGENEVAYEIGREKTNLNFPALISVRANLLDRGLHPDGRTPRTVWAARIREVVVPCGAGELSGIDRKSMFVAVKVVSIGSDVDIEPTPLNEFTADDLHERTWL
jgi:hypothetical protein